jgi:hypothetical protein
MRGLPVRAPETGDPAFHEAAGVSVAVTKFVVQMPVPAVRPDAPFGDPEQRRHPVREPLCDPVGHGENTVRLCRVGDPLDLDSGTLGFRAPHPVSGVLARQAILRVPLLCRTSEALFDRCVADIVSGSM